MDDRNVYHASVTHVSLVGKLDGQNGGGSAAGVESENAVGGGVGAVVEEGAAAGPEVAVLVDNCRYSQIRVKQLCIRCQIPVPGDRIYVTECYESDAHLQSYRRLRRKHQWRRRWVRT